MSKTFYFQQLARDRSKKERTKAALYDGLVDVIATHGLEGLTVQLVTRESGLSQGTFYNHFEDREALIVETACLVSDQIKERIGPQLRHVGAGITRLVRAIDLTISEAVKRPDHGALLAATMGRYPQVVGRIRPKLRADINAALSAGEITVAASRLCDEQISTLIGLAIRLRLGPGRGSSLNRQTIEAVLRLLGQSAEQAEHTVAQALDQAPDKTG